MKTKIHKSFGFSISFDASSYHVRVTVPVSQRQAVVNRFSLPLYARFLCPVSGDPSDVHTIHFCFPLKDLNALLPYGFPPSTYLYNLFVETLFQGMMDTVCPSVY